MNNQGTNQGMNNQRVKRGMKRGAAAEICARGQAEMCAAGPGSGPPQVPPIAPRRKRGAASNARRAARQLRQQPSGRSKGCVQATPGTAERTLAARRPRGAFTHLSGSAGAQGVRSDRRRRCGCSRGVACCNTLQEICRGEAPPRYLNAPGAPRAHASESPAPGVDREPSL